MRSRHNGLVGALALAVMILAMAPHSKLFADAPIPGSKDLAPTSTFRVQVDGTEIREARFYVGSSGLLILDCDLKEPILVGKGDKTVRYVQEQNVVSDDQGNLSIRGTPSQPICSYQVSGGHIIFKAEGREIRLLPKKPLEGSQTLTAIIEHSPDYGARVEAYRPNQEAVDYLGTYARKTEFEIYFGSWCSICEAWIPRLVKSLQTAGNPQLQTRFYALPRNFGRKPIVLEKGIKGVPTIILRQNGREIGRHQGRPERGSLEEAMVKLLKTSAP